MTGQRPPLRGQGYMVKGGRAATIAHNEAARAAAPAADATNVAPASSAPIPADHRTDARVSGWSAAGRTDREAAVVAVIAAAASVAAAGASVVSAVLR